MANLSERLLQLKKERGLLQKNIANGLGLALRTYQYYESGERKPDSGAIVAMCRYFGVSADYLLGLKDEPERR
ncbi:MAG: helix-turn-helix domain-containing protein [Acidaminococcales bacterium]|jgi:transcriptional regulator with XRE-family HTH domain|nr:helix-turn-helix domain-containing protein [Acidaminococcales bacterium]